MPALSLMTPLGLSWLEGLPPAVASDPDIRAVLHCYAKETELIDAKMDWIIDQFFPTRAAATGIGMWEAHFNLQIAPPSQTLAQRRSLVLSYYRSILNAGSGADWEAAVTQLVGPSWSYDEHDPDDATLTATVPDYSLRVLLPFPAGTPDYERARALVAALLPANQHLILGASAGFFLDQGLLDADVLG